MEKLRFLVRIILFPVKIIVSFRQGSLSETLKARKTMGLVTAEITLVQLASI